MCHWLQDLSSYYSEEKPVEQIALNLSQGCNIIVTETSLLVFLELLKVLRATVKRVAAQLEGQAGQL